jgi:hypothetical protein
MRRRRRREAILDALTALAAIAALTFLARERLVPWIEDRGIIDPGDAVEDREVLDAVTGDPIALSSGTPTLLFVFRSTCPACAAAVPAWSALSGAGAWTTLAVGLEPAHTAAAYAHSSLPTVRPVVPLDAAEFAKRFRIRVVPTTLAIDSGGRLVMRRVGPLDEEDLKELRRVIDVSEP